MDQPLESGGVREVSTLHPINIGEIERHVAWHQVNVSIRLSGAQRGLLVSTQFGIGMSGRASVVRTVASRRDAGVRQLGQTKHYAVGEVPGGIDLSVTLRLAKVS
ncbi:MAG: hypothetical protein ACKVQT_36415 [Burkholderiales bacterium]